MGMNVAVVGFGGMGRHHAHAVAERVPGMKLAGIRDLNPEREAIARGLGWKVYTSFEEVLEDESVDAIVVATPNDLHREMTIRALEAGKHVICEKPAAMNSEELQEMIDTAEACGRVFMVHQNRRWDKDFLTIKRILEENLLSDVYHIESRILGSRGIPGDWRGQKAFGGGMMLDWGVHIIDQMLLLVDEPVRSVYCQLSHLTNDEVDDGFVLRLTFASGRTAHLEVGTHHFVNLPRWYVVGRDGTAVVWDFDLHGNIIKVKSWEDKDVQPVRTGAGWTKTMAPRTASTTDEWGLPEVHSDVHDFYHNFMATVDGRGVPVVPNEQVFRVMRLMEAAFESDRLGQVLEFESDGVLV